MHERLASEESVARKAWLALRLELQIFMLEVLTGLVKKN